MRTIRLVFLFVLALTLSAQGWVSQVVVFGDSLSDTGNFKLTYKPQVWPYIGDGASNGPLAVQKMAEHYGVRLVNHAWFGATTGIGNEFDKGTQTKLGTLGMPGMTTAYEAVKAAGLDVDPQAVYVVWAGPNDLKTNGQSPRTLAAAVSNIVRIVNELEAAGAKHILVPGMPDLGLTPAFVGTAGQPAATAVSDAFNALLVSALPLKANYFDITGWMRRIFTAPDKYGFTNVTTPCYGASLCAAPDSYFFWDDFHPTTTAHALMGELFAECAQTRGGDHSALCRAGVAAGKPREPGKPDDPGKPADPGKPDQPGKPKK